MYHQTGSNSNLPPNYLQFHEHAFVSPLNLINVTHPAPISFGRAPHLLQQTIPHLQSIDANKLHMYEFLAQRKLEEDRRKQEQIVKPTFRPQRNIRSSQPQPRPKKPQTRSASAPKKSIPIKKPESHITPSPIHFSRPNDPLTALSLGKKNEIADIHDQLLVQLRILHNPPTRENIIDETEQEKQRRIRLKRERIKRDSRAIYNAHQELKQILQDIHQSDANLPRLIHRHLNAYKAILLAVETLANEAPLKPQDAPIQQLSTALIPVLETLINANHAFGLPQLQIDRSYLHLPPSKSVKIIDQRSSPSNHLLPSIYNELIKKKQQHRKPKQIPSVLRPRSAESTRLPRTDSSSISRPTISMQHKTRARSHSPLPSIRSSSTTETPFYSRYTLDHILGKLAPRLFSNYTGRELSEQVERARTLIPMFLVDNRLSDDEIVNRVLQMLMPRQQKQIPSSTTKFEIFETPEERERRVNIDVYHTQISEWEDEMSQIRQRIQNYKTNRLENETTSRRKVTFQLYPTPISPPSLPENVEIHKPLFESTLEDLIVKPNENNQTNTQPRGDIRLYNLDSHKIREIERYRRDYQGYLQRTESAKSKDFDPCQVINRLSEFLLDEALLSVVNEVELLTVELSQKLVENELLGQEISLADVEKQQQQHQHYRRPVERRHSPRSPSPPNEQYNTSSFEEDINSESKISRSEDEENIPRRKSPMEGTGRFTTAAFEHRKSPMEGTGRFTTTAFEHRKLPLRSRSSSSSSSSTESPAGIILKPTIIVKKPSSIHEEINQYSDHDLSEARQPQKSFRRQSTADEDDDDDDLLLSTKTGEKIYSTDFEESKARHRHTSDDDDEDVDTMKLSARSAHKLFDSDDDDD